MKKPIDVKDILKGDLIWCEYINPGDEDVAREYIASYDRHGSVYEVRHYLLDRPEPPFEPYWGMVIGHPSVITDRAVYIPAYDGETLAWLTDDKTVRSDSWKRNKWAEQKLKEGWVVIDKPEGVK